MAPSNPFVTASNAFTNSTFEGAGPGVMGPPGGEGPTIRGLVALRGGALVRPSKVLAGGPPAPCPGPTSAADEVAGCGGLTRGSGVVLGEANHMFVLKSLLWAGVLPANLPNA